MNRHSVFVTIACSLLACTTSPPSPYFGTSTVRHPANELWVNNGTEPESIDPGTCADGVGGEIILNLFAGLVELNPQTLVPEPELATHWEVSADGLTYTFHLRPSVWSDGVEVTANDFVWSWRRVLDPATSSKYAAMLYLLKNGEALHQKRSTELGVQALDKYTLQVTLEHPAPYFLSLLAFYTFMPVPQHLLARLAAQHISENQWTRPEYIVSNGAYTLESWLFRRELRLRKNPRYWNASLVKIEHVVLSEVESYTTALNLYQTGDLDWTGSNTSLPSEFLDHLKTFQDFHRDPYLSVYFYWINTQMPPLDNVKLRQALSLALDRPSLTKFLTKGGQVPTADLVPDGLAGYQGGHSPLFDPVRARELLHEAGYKSGADVPPITLIYNTSEGHKQVAQAVQAMWKEHLGITLNLENQEWKVFLGNMSSGQFQLARMGWVGDYADPNTFLHDVLASYSGNNHSGWHDKNYDAMLNRANQERDPALRMAALQKAEAYMLAAQPIIPFYIYTRSYMLKPYVRGFTPNYQDRHAFKYLWIDTSEAH